MKKRQCILSLTLVMLILFFGSETSSAATLGLEASNTGTGWFVSVAQAEITIYMRIPSVGMNEEAQTEALGETEEANEAEETNETEETEETGEIENPGETEEMKNPGETEETENPGETGDLSTQG